VKIYFCGQLEFGNHGCEALIKSTVQLINERVPSKNQFFVPSLDAAADKAMWPEAEGAGVEFVSPPAFGSALKWWGRLESRAPFPLAPLYTPRVTPGPSSEMPIRSADAVVVTGGDIISLEYGVPSLFHWVGLAEHAMRLGKPVHIVAASIGPFSSRPDIEGLVVKFLKKCTSVTVREHATKEYLSALGVNTDLVADPAFNLKAEPFDLDATIFEEPVLGLNVSPLIRNFRNNEEDKSRLDEELVNFLDLMVSKGTRVLLVPHVDPLDGSTVNSDRHYMEGLVSRMSNGNGNVFMLPPLLNAGRLKYAIGKCSWFIGARTHATIAAISQGVPTVSIAYSVKAVGINRQVFGDTRYVLPTPDVSAVSLEEALKLLRDDGANIKLNWAQIGGDLKALSGQSVHRVIGDAG